MQNQRLHFTSLRAEKEARRWDNTMKRKWTRHICLLVLAATTGCGTILRNKTSSQLYPALQVDHFMYIVWYGIWDETKWQKNGDESLGLFAAIWGFLFTTADLPISAATDTALIPYDLWVKEIKTTPQPCDTPNPHSPSAQGAGSR